MKGKSNTQRAMLAVEVLEEKPWEWVFECKGCGSKLKAKERAVMKAYFDGNYLESGKLDYYVPCPLCETDNRIPKSKQNARIKKKAKLYREGD